MSVMEDFEKTNALEDQEMWLINSGSTCHITTNNAMLRNVRETTRKVKIGDHTAAPAKKMGNLFVTTHDGAPFEIRDVLFIPNFMRNIISLSALLKAGFEIKETDKKLVFCGNQMEFTTKREDNGFFLLQLTRHENMVKSKIVSKKLTRIDINKAHQKLGHMVATRLYKNFSNCSYKVTGTLNCSAC